LQCTDDDNRSYRNDYNVVDIVFIGLDFHYKAILHLYLLKVYLYIIVLLLVPADGIPGSGLSSFEVK